MMINNDNNIHCVVCLVSSGGGGSPSTGGKSPFEFQLIERRTCRMTEFIRRMNTAPWIPPILTFF